MNRDQSYDKDIIKKEKQKKSKSTIYVGSRAKRFSFSTIKGMQRRKVKEFATGSETARTFQYFTTLICI